MMIMDMPAQIIRYENGELTEEEENEFFQELVNSGMAWKLQGHYRRRAVDMLMNGEIAPRYTDEMNAVSLGVSSSWS